MHLTFQDGTQVPRCHHGRTSGIRTRRWLSNGLPRLDQSPLPSMSAMNLPLTQEVSSMPEIVATKGKTRIAGESQTLNQSKLQKMIH
jgi:hypothetical protein